jgi:hypothetical protein
MLATPSAAESARLRLLVAAEERKKARELEDAQIAKDLAREMARIDQEEREERRRVKEAEDRQREQEGLEAVKQAQRQAMIWVKWKAVVLDEEPVAGGSGSSVSVYFRFESTSWINNCVCRGIWMI